jgi:TetR/AcrR family transcriptional repressor of nem operon
MEFDETQALEAAMRCFWLRGYEGTSMRDLVDQMGLTGASIYNAFGDKRTVFQRALDFYLHQSVRDRVRRLDQISGLEAIRAFFDEIIDRSVTDKLRRGCMLVNSAIEVAPHDSGILAKISPSRPQLGHSAPRRT